jgi:hypothetical protein
MTNREGYVNELQLQKMKDTFCRLLFNISSNISRQEIRCEWRNIFRVCEVCLEADAMLCRVTI